jgi:hypothetical protein
VSINYKSEDIKGVMMEWAKILPSKEMVQEVVLRVFGSLLICQFQTDLSFKQELQTHTYGAKSFILSTSFITVLKHTNQN